MKLSSLAGKLLPPDALVDLAKLERDYLTRPLDFADPEQRVSFGTSGHRGSSLRGSFNEAHVLAITQAICDYRHAAKTTGPLFLGRDTHALSPLAQITAMEVLGANGIEVVLQSDDRVTPTPVISRAILVYNAKREVGLADGIVITPSHNPPEEGGYKYNPTNGGPADTEITTDIQKRANALLADGNKNVKRIPFEKAMRVNSTHFEDFLLAYVADLENVIDLATIQKAGLKLGVDPLGGASLRYWEAIQKKYALDLTVVNPHTDPRFAFVPADHDGKIRMDPSSPYPMTGLVHQQANYHLAFGNDPDSDRFGVVTPGAGLLNPNHFLTAAIHYLLTHRERWSVTALIGKTVVSTEMIDRVVKSLDRKICEVPVGFKWFAPGLFDGSFCFGGEESAGASFLRKDGRVWSTDKDGIILNLLAVEMTARMKQDPGSYYQTLTEKFGNPLYTRIDTPADPKVKARLSKLSPEEVKQTDLAGEPVIAKITKAPGNHAAIGGIKISTANGWFAARPSGTENIYKIYAESFKDQAHLDAIVNDAQKLIAG